MTLLFDTYGVNVEFDAIIVVLDVVLCFGIVVQTSKDPAKALTTISKSNRGSKSAKRPPRHNNGTTVAQRKSQDQ